LTLGDVTEGELECGTSEEDDSLQVSRNFTSGSHFYEEVEDTKDSIWLVHVMKDRHSALLNELDWRNLVKKLVRFGVRTGIFDCSTDWR
jgi:E3 ubiquitin-protein ligase RNF103